MTVLEELVNIMTEARDQSTVSIPMEMAVKIVFALSRFGQIMPIIDEIRNYKYTELDKEQE